jgi:DNA-binding XRE family transcriptional regulator
MQIERLHLKTARRQRGMTAFELAQMIGTTENRVYGIERGRYSPDTDLALRWAASLDLNPGEAFPEIWGAQ